MHLVTPRGSHSEGALRRARPAGASMKTYCLRSRASEKRSTGIFRVETGRRFYNSDSGRWLNRDPIEERGGLNVYSFVHIQPLQFFDPDGRAFPIVIGGVVITVGALDIAAAGAGLTAIGCLMNAQCRNAAIAVARAQANRWFQRRRKKRSCELIGQLKPPTGKTCWRCTYRCPASPLPSTLKLSLSRADVL